nr:hypothetical protein [Desulfobacterales bacterium]
MKKTIAAFVVVAFFFGGGAFAHFGPTFYVPEVPPGVTITIDGDDSDWAWYDPAYVIDRTYIHEYHVGAEDPSVEDWDGFAMVAWTQPPDNMIYIYSRVTDDKYSAIATEPGMYPSDDSMELGLDANHNGGDFREPEDINGKDAYQVGIDAAGTIPLVVNNHPAEQRWVLEEPWFVAWANNPGEGAEDVTLIYEMKFALWDYVGYGGPDDPETQRHINEAGQTIGMYLRWFDTDYTPGSRDHGVMAAPVGALEAWRNADFFQDYVLVAAEVSVEAQSWGLIKALFK